MRSRRAKDAGFTLIEVLIASAITALIATAAMTAFISAMRLQQADAAALARVEFARSYFAEIDATNALEPTTGTYEDRFTYALTIEPMEIEQPNRFTEIVALFHLKLDVTDTRKPETTEAFDFVVSREK